MSLVKQDKAVWEHAYQSGAWRTLESNAEFAHYTVVAGFIQQQRKPVSLLDIGCGEGVILRYLNLELIEKYTGVDLTQSALERLQPKRPQDRLICSSLEEYAPDDKWDVVLFNEVLYYTHNPVTHLRKFEPFLKPGGTFVVSMYQKANPFAYNNRCSRRLRKHFRKADYAILDAVEVRSFVCSARWQMFLVQPTSR